MTCSEALCYGLFCSYPVISLALNSIPGPRRGEREAEHRHQMSLVFAETGELLLWVSNETLHASTCADVCTASGDWRKWE